MLTKLKISVFIKDNPGFSLFILYATGVVLWNLYLSSYGFFEFNLIQIRYLSAGLLVWVPTLSAVYFFNFLLAKYPLLKNADFFFKFITLVLFVGILFSFPFIPQYLGGAKPVPVFILAKPEQIKLFESLDIKPSDNAGRQPVETEDVCLIYQGVDYIVFFSVSNFSTTTASKWLPDFKFSSRTIILSRNELIGFQIIRQPVPSCTISTAYYNRFIVSF